MMTLDLTKVSDRCFDRGFEFLRESVRKIAPILDGGECRAATVDMAIVDLAHCFELVVKGRLARVNPLFVFEDIEKPNHLIGITGALRRLILPHMGGGPPV